MLNASDEDFELACETIANMGLYEPYLIIFVRQMTLSRRTKFIQRLTAEKKDLDAKLFSGVHKKVIDYFKELTKKDPPQNFKDCFEFFVANDVIKAQAPFLNNDIVKNITVKLKW